MIAEHRAVYELYGLCVDSPIALPACLVPDGKLPDLKIYWQENREDQVAGRVLAANGLGSTLYESGEGYRLHVEKVGDFRISKDLRVIDVGLLPGVVPETAAVFLSASVPAVVLALAGEEVLHASAVEVEGRALAFVGDSGSGKSTLAALLCACGTSLVSDDVLRLQQQGTDFSCFSGPEEIRLRPGAIDLLKQLAAPSRVSVDGRLAVRVGSSRTMPRLCAIVIPYLSRTATVIRAERLSPAAGLLRLQAFPRIMGKQERALIEHQFQAMSEIARSVPIFEAEIPWGPPFTPDTSEKLLAALGFFTCAERDL